ncbi:MAG: DUF2073 domain-containing protein [Candidatus Woesearchaeota archaeon]
MISFQYIPYREHSRLDTEKKLSKILKIVRKDKIVLMQGRLKSSEEAQLIERTMGQITKDFPGISFCTIYPENNNTKKPNQIQTKLKNLIYNLILGNRDCLTIVGPASIVTEIRKNPNKIDLLTKSI